MKKIFTALSLTTLLLVSCQPITGPKGHAIIFGIELYEPFAANLNWTIDDAVAIASLLETDGWEVQLFTDASATKAELEATLKTMVNSDLPVLFYYSGHGAYGNFGDGVKYYICTAGNLTSSQMVNPEELNAMFISNNIKHGLAILDSCKSGGFVSADGTISGIPDNIISDPFNPATSLTIPALNAYLTYAQSKNVIVLSAAGAKEESVERGPPYNHGIFTYYLLESAQYGDSDGDGFVSTVEAFAYSARSLDASFNQSSGSPYLPRFSGEPRDYLLFKTMR